MGQINTYVAPRRISCRGLGLTHSTVEKRLGERRGDAGSISLGLFALLEAKWKNTIAAISRKAPGSVNNRVRR